MIRSDPDDAATALEIELVDEEWLQAPGNGPSRRAHRVRFCGASSSARSSAARPSCPRSASRLSSFCRRGRAAAAGAPAGRPRPLTVVFTDLEGFTAYTDTHGDAVTLALIDEHHQRAAPIVRRWNGRIVKHLGDGLLCTFPKPAWGVPAPPSTCWPAHPTRCGCGPACTSAKSWRRTMWSATW